LIIYQESLFVVKLTGFKMRTIKLMMMMMIMMMIIIIMIIIIIIII